MFTHPIYVKSPVFIQTGFLSIRALARKLLRENASSDRVCKEITRNERDAQRLSRFGACKLADVLHLASAKVPFYRKACDGTDLGNIHSYPYITKQDVKSFPDLFRLEAYEGTEVKGSTSGTTGTPMSIPQTMESVIREQAFISRSLQWAGYAKGEKRAWIRGDMIVPLEQKKAPYWRYSYFEDMILLSSFHMTQAALPLYINAMVNYGVDIIQAYPSSILMLAKYLDVTDQYYPGELKSIITSSEPLSKDDKELVEKRFNCTVFDWYGLFERVAAIASCEHGRYHILTDYSHVELLDCGDGRHEIIGTNFNNSLYPLIRYKTGDHVVLTNEVACPCGRVYPLVDHIEGRIGGYLIGEDGQKIHILNHIPKGVNGLIATQFVQTSLSHIQVLVVVDNELFTVEQKDLLIANTNKRVGQSICVDVEVVEQLPKTKNGKVRQAICEVDR